MKKNKVLEYRRKKEDLNIGVAGGLVTGGGFLSYQISLTEGWGP